MSDQTSATYENEVKAIGDLLSSLEPLTGPARERVLTYVANALNIALPSLSLGSPPSVEVQHTPAQSPDAAPTSTNPPRPPARHTDIRSLRDSKEPGSAVEMAAIVAFYLSELAPENERSQTIGAADLDKYFKQAGYRLPKAQNMTLVNGASAGYFDRVSQGEYKLNPVGYNLVAHNLPSRTKDAGSTARPTKRARPAGKAAAVKKVAKKRPQASKKTTPANR